MEWKYLGTISLQGSGTKSPFCIIEGTRCKGIQLNQQFTQDICYSLMPIYGTMYVWKGNIFEIMIFSMFWQQMILFCTIWCIRCNGIHLSQKSTYDFIELA